MELTIQIIDTLPTTSVAASLQVMEMRAMTPPTDPTIEDKFQIALSSAPEELLEPSLLQVFKDTKSSLQLSENPRVSQLGDDVVVTCLGTGSAMPSKYRNGASIHLAWYLANWEAPFS